MILLLIPVVILCCAIEQRHIIHVHTILRDLGERAAAKILIERRLEARSDDHALVPPYTTTLNRSMMKRLPSS